MVARNAGSLAKKAEPTFEAVFDQITPTLKKYRDKPGRLASEIIKFEIKAGKDSARASKLLGMGIFSALALGAVNTSAQLESLHPGAFADDTGAKQAAIAGVYNQAGVVATEGEFITPTEALEFIKQGGLQPSKVLAAQVKTSGRWAAQSVQNMDNAIQAKVIQLIGREAGAEGITNKSELTSAIGRMDFDSFLNAWETEGLPTLTQAQTQLIFGQNMNTAFSAGRWTGIVEDANMEEAVGLEYISALLPTTRPEHSQWHMTVHPIESAFWDSWYPPNGFNCYCDVITVYSWEQGSAGLIETAQLSEKQRIKLLSEGGRVFVPVAPKEKPPVYTTANGTVYDFGVNVGAMLLTGNVQGLAF